MMIARIDRSGCISCGLCVDVCPEVFGMADDGLADVHGEVTDDNYDLAKRAENGCPVSVIEIQD